MKANFKISKEKDNLSKELKNEKHDKKITQEEFEEFISKSGAKGSFMVFRSTKKEDEMGIDEL